jgi:hypothetical protein
MRIEHREVSADYAVPMAVYLIAFALVAGLGCFAGYRLMQPRVIPNLGLAAYQPPPGTRLIPLPHKSDAPELADLPPTPVAVETAQPERPPESVEQTTVAATPKPVAKRPKPRPVDDPWAAYAYGDRWGDGDRRGYSGRWDRSRSYSSSRRGGWNDRW